MPSNRAAYLNKKGEALTVSVAPMPKPGKNQIVLKSQAIAINPIDWKMQDYGFFIESWPVILGVDVAGTVESVGPGVSEFAEGDRVFAHCCSLGTHNNAESAFQEYVLVMLPVAAKIPDNLSFEEAVVLPLGVDTAAAGLFEQDKLGLSMPPSNDGKGKTVLIWGGSSSVGSCAIQLAVAAGYEVVATASKHNHEYCKSLGASEVFDYKSDSLVEDVNAVLKNKKVVGGYDTISEENTVKTCCAILSAVGAKKLATTLPGTDDYAAHGVEVKPVFAVTVASNEVGPKLWEYLPKAIKEGKFQAKPDPVSGGKGLESLQKAMEMQKKGVSGKKVVVTI